MKLLNHLTLKKQPKVQKCNHPESGFPSFVIQRHRFSDISHIPTNRCSFIHQDIKTDHLFVAFQDSLTCHMTSERAGFVPWNVSIKFSPDLYRSIDDPVFPDVSDVSVKQLELHSHHFNHWKSLDQKLQYPTDPLERSRSVLLHNRQQQEMNKLLIPLGFICLWSDLVFTVNHHVCQ